MLVHDTILKMEKAHTYSDYLENKITSPSLDLLCPPPPPVLRVEELKEEDKFCTTPSSSTSNSDCQLSSENEDKQFSKPSEELIRNIIEQTEFYFSDEHILQDLFLLKHARKNRQGFISIKLLTSFKKIKVLTKDYRVVAYALQFSKKLQLNDDKRKVRRIEPIPNLDDSPTKSIIAINLPFENCQIVNVIELFQQCGEVTLVQIIKPGGSTLDVKKYLDKHPDLKGNSSAIIEFDKKESVDKALNSFKINDKNSNIKVYKFHKQTPKNTTKSKGEKIEESKKFVKKKQSFNSISYQDSGSDTDNIDYYSNKNRNRSSSFTKNRLSPAMSPKSSPLSSPGHSPRSSPSLRRRSIPVQSPLASTSPNTSPRINVRNESPSNSLWHRKSSGSFVNSREISPRNSPGVHRKIFQDIGIIRQPRGPGDNTVEPFYGGKGRGIVK